MNKLVQIVDKLTETSTMASWESKTLVSYWHTTVIITKYSIFSRQEILASVNSFKLQCYKYVHSKRIEWILLGVNQVFVTIRLIPINTKRDTRDIKTIYSLFYFFLSILTIFLEYSPAVF